MTSTGKSRLVNTWGLIPLGATRVQVRQIILVAAIASWILSTILLTGVSCIFALALNAAFVLVLWVLSTASRTLDKYAVMNFVCWGGMLMGVSGFLESQIAATFGSDSGMLFCLNAPMEELLKLVPLWLFLWRGKNFTTWTLSATDFFILGGACGAGFGFVQSSFLHVDSNWQNQIYWMPSSELIGDRFVAGHAVWTGLAGGMIGLASIWKHKKAPIIAWAGIIFAILDHLATDYALLHRDWGATALGFCFFNGYLIATLFLLAFAAAVASDRFVLFAALPKISEFRVPTSKDTSVTYQKFWEFVLDRRKLAYAYFRYTHTLGTAKRDAALVVSILMQTLINAHRPADVQLDSGDSQSQLKTMDMTSERTIDTGFGAHLDTTVDQYPDLPEQYTVVGTISEGGMGIIYEGRHKLTGAKRAIKVLHSHLARQEHSIRRFNTEASAASALKHPNLVVVHDFGFTKSRVPYLIMDLIEGTSLQKEIRESGPLSIPRFINIFCQACDALAHAHRRGVIHRDLKPSNMILTMTEDGLEMIGIVDFGIAKVMPVADVETQELTKTGDLVGSPMYMSPEQCVGNPLDPRSDIYSLGCVMYESLTGRPPFIGGNAVQTIFKHLNEMPARPSSVCSQEIPAPLETILFRCLQKNASARYSTMEDVRHELESYSRHELGGAIKAYRSE